MTKIIALISAVSFISLGVTPDTYACDLKNHDKNRVSITTETITNEIKADDGTIIPAGSIAVTLSVNGNTGFDTSINKLDIGDSDIIIASSGTPAYSSGSLLDSSLISSAEKGNMIAFASASSSVLEADGDLLTFYVSSSLDKAEIVETQIINAYEERSNTTSSTKGTLYSYIIGDINNNDKITASDASGILYAVDLFYQSHNSKEDFEVSYANTNLSTYFPNTFCAEPADVDEGGIINNQDAQWVLTYYANAALGNTSPVQYVGELRYIILQ